MGLTTLLRRRLTTRSTLQPTGARHKSRCAGVCCARPRTLPTAVTAAAAQMPDGMIVVPTTIEYFVVVVPTVWVPPSYILTCERCCGTVRACAARTLRCPPRQFALRHSRDGASCQRLGAHHASGQNSSALRIAAVATACDETLGAAIAEQ